MHSSGWHVPATNHVNPALQWRHLVSCDPLLTSLAHCSVIMGHLAYHRYLAQFP